MTTPGPDLRSRLETFLSEKLGSVVRVESARQLAGGASRESWAVDLVVTTGPEAGQHALVMRRDLGGVIHEEALSREQEFRLLDVAYRAGVRSPQPRWLCTDPAVLGQSFFLMDRLEGEAVGRRVVREPALAAGRSLLPRQLGEQLARIHAIDVAGLNFLPRMDTGLSPAQTALTQSVRQLKRLGEPHPALELALRWLTKRAPGCAEPVLVHGDFRIGNLLVSPAGLSGVLDWEFAHVGDPAEDLAWPCVRSWRFGHDELRLGGIGQPEEFYDAYTHAGGKPIDRSALAFWEVLGNFRWAVGCMVQADRHLSGQSRSVELASLGRRAAEMELEVLDLIDQHDRIGEQPR